MRRMFWVGIGAVLGVTGYRRLTRAAKSLLGQQIAVPAGRQSAGQGLALSSSVLGWLAPRLRPGRRPAREVAAGIISFIRDVRTGSAEYLDTHGG